MRSQRGRFSLIYNKTKHLLPSKKYTGDIKGCSRSSTSALAGGSALDNCLLHGGRACVTPVSPPSVTTHTCLQKAKYEKGNLDPSTIWSPLCYMGRQAGLIPISACNTKYIRGCFSILLILYYIYFSNFASPLLFPQQTNSRVEQAWIILIPFYFISLWHSSVCFGEEGVVGACVLLCNYKLAF